MQRRLALAVFLLVLLAGCSAREGEPGFPPTTPFDPETLQDLHAIRDEVSELRRLSVNPEVNEGWIASADYAGYIQTAYGDLDDETRGFVEGADAVLKLLGILDAHDSYYEQALDISSNYIAGFYDFDLDELVLVGGDGSLSHFDRATIAHEYVHSFQEELTSQHDWEGRFEVLMDDDENPLDYAYTLGCVLEGDASLAEAHFTGAGIETWDYYVEYMSWMERNLYFDYSVCLEFVDYVYQRGGWDAVNALYADPPVSLEQAMHPEKYFAGEGPTALAPFDFSTMLGRGWERSVNGVFNEFDVWNYVLTLTGELDLADRAASGWGMGWMAIYTHGSGDKARTAGHLSLQFDTRKDFGEFEVAFASIVKALGGAGHGWTTDVGDGRAHWDRSDNRVDIFVSTDAAILDAAARALGYQVLEAAASTR